jgi:hypothetical protein
VEKHGTVHLSPAPGGRGTELQCNLGFRALQGIPQVPKEWLQALTSKQLAADLRCLKQILEIEVHAVPLPDL